MRFRFSILVIVFYLGFKIDVLSQDFKTEEFLFGACVEVKVKHGFRDRLSEKTLTGTYTIEPFTVHWLEKIKNP